MVDPFFNSKEAPRFVRFHALLNGQVQQIAPLDPNNMLMLPTTRNLYWSPQKTFNTNEKFYNFKSQYIQYLWHQRSVQGIRVIQLNTLSTLHIFVLGRHHFQTGLRRNQGVDGTGWFGEEMQIGLNFVSSHLNPFTFLSL